MIWSPSRRFCFIHVPKTGGTAITLAYEPHMRFDDLILGGTALGEVLQRHYRQRFGLHKHAGAAVIAKAAGGEAFRAMWSVAIVRDPLSRLISFYRWLRHPKGVHHPLKDAAGAMDFEAFIAHARPHLRPQIAHLRIGGQVAVSRLYRFEELDAAWANIAAALGIDGPLPHRNAATAEAPPISAAARAAVEQAYAEDFALWRSIPCP